MRPHSPRLSRVIPCTTNRPHIRNRRLYSSDCCIGASAAKKIHANSCAEPRLRKFQGNFSTIIHTDVAARECTVISYLSSAYFVILSDFDPEDYSVVGEL